MVTRDALVCTKMLSPKIDRYQINTSYDVTDYRGESFYLIILGDDIFRTLERIESNQPYFTTLLASHLIFTINLDTYTGEQDTKALQFITEFNLKLLLKKLSSTLNLD